MGLPHLLSGLECTHTQMHADAHKHSDAGSRQRDCCTASSFIPFKGRVSEDVSVPLCRLQSVLSCPSISSSLPLTFLLLLGCWKTLLASLPTSLQALYFTDSSRLFPFSFPPLISSFPTLFSSSPLFSGGGMLSVVQSVIRHGAALSVSLYKQL
mgnify:CR=1 FL=1